MVNTREQAAKNAEASTVNVPDSCQLWTRTQFNAPSAGDVDGDGASDAEDGWKSEPAKYRHTDRKPPRGTPVSYLGGSGDNGHRAISLGPINGVYMIRSTDAGGRGRVATVPLDWPERIWGLTYAGWSESIDGFLIPHDAAVPKPKPKPVPPPSLKVGMWNLKVGRKPAVVVAEVSAFLKANDLDVVMVCEAHQYARPLAKALRSHGYRVVRFGRDGSARDSAVIVRRSLKPSRKRLHRLERKGWERRPGRKGLHWPRSAVSVRVNWLRVMAAHTPPGPFGPRFPLRKAANEAAFKTLGRIFARWNKHGVAWVAGPDWNRHMDDGVAKAFLVSSDAQAVGSGIDWVASHGAIVTNMREHKVGTSDHWPKTFTATKEHP